MKRIFNCLMIIIGTLIGAGFASGKEISTFFNYFSDNGLAGIILASVLFGLIIACILLISSKQTQNLYKDYIKNKYASFIIKAFAFICFCIMISAIGTFGKIQFNLPFSLGTIMASAICFLLFMFKFKGLEKINNVLVPIILIGIAIIGCLPYTDSVLTLESTAEESILLKSWVQSAILYVGYNSILLVPILFETGKYKFNKKEIALVSISVTLILCLIGLMIFSSINEFYPEILNAEMPMLSIAKLSNNVVYQLYNVVILFAVFTTAFSCGFAFLQMNLEKNYFRNCIIICLASILVSRIGFSNLINWCFPIFGYIGIIQFIYIILSSRRK